MDDGSSDGTVPLLQKLVAAAAGGAELLQLPQNCGKAEAVRRGMLHALERTRRAQRQLQSYVVETVVQLVRGSSSRRRTAAAQVVRSAFASSADTHRVSREKRLRRLHRCSCFVHLLQTSCAQHELPPHEPAMYQAAFMSYSLTALCMPSLNEQDV